MVYGLSNALKNLNSYCQETGSRIRDSFSPSRGFSSQNSVVTRDAELADGMPVMFFPYFPSTFPISNHKNIQKISRISGRVEPNETPQSSSDQSAVPSPPEMNHDFPVEDPLPEGSRGSFLLHVLPS